MSGKVNEITIVGGGDSGLISALSIRRLNPELDITVIDDFEQDIPQVGKSTYIKIVDLLHSFLGIKENRFIENVKPVWKGSVYFKDWCGREPFHFPFDHVFTFPGDSSPYDEPNLGQRYYHFYHQLAADERCLTKGERIVEEQKSPFYYDLSKGGLERYRSVAYHLNTRRFNSFLRRLCRSRGIELVDDHITDVTVDGNEVSEVRGQDSSYTADLYVDSTGFSRKLVGETPREFHSFELRLDSALNVQLPRDLGDVIPATVIESGEAGWFWQIDTFDNRDVGYVYSSDFLTEEEALQEFVDHIDGNPEHDEISRLSFDSGFYPKAWQGNCIAMGNAMGFVEPLQSTGLTVNAWAAQILSRELTSNGGLKNSGSRERFNSWIENMWKSVYDFISIHYAFAEGSGDFWRDVDSLTLSDRAQFLKKEFEKRGFADHVNPAQHAPNVSSPLVFGPIGFYIMFHRLGVESSLYEEQEFNVSDAVKENDRTRFRNFREEVEDYLTIEEVYSFID